ncbi:hypothetical protein QN277_019130 [Acacia crassicarpa]|uniref:Uncharacterized protein n=1 Tax=Acacia crassicarpa TaxID=499986 RepID=A0AAE1JY22_9FABA|nr:hypothetical protein QN277_019130 [Acacia crassicarpa]
MRHRQQGERLPNITSIVDFCRRLPSIPADLSFSIISQIGIAGFISSTCKGGSYNIISQIGIVSLPSSPASILNLGRWTKFSCVNEVREREREREREMTEVTWTKHPALLALRCECCT